MSAIINKINIDFPNFNLNDLDSIETDKFASFFKFQNGKFDRFGKDIKDVGSFDDLNPENFDDKFFKDGHNKDNLFAGGENNNIQDSDSFFGTLGEVFEFNGKEFSSEDFDSIVDNFQLGEDPLGISGLSDSNKISNDPITGDVSIDGHEIDVNKFTDPNIKENKDGDYEIL